MSEKVIFEFRLEDERESVTYRMALIWTYTKSSSLGRGRVQ